MALEPSCPQVIAFMSTFDAQWALMALSSMELAVSLLHSCAEHTKRFWRDRSFPPVRGAWAPGRGSSAAKCKYTKSMLQSYTGHTVWMMHSRRRRREAMH